MKLDTVKMSTEFTDDLPFDPAALQMRVVELPVPRPFWRLSNFYYRGELDTRKNRVGEVGNAMVAG